MVIIKTKKDIEIMREAGKIAAGALNEVESIIRRQSATRDINKFLHDYITRYGASPTFLGYNNFPASACISVNNEVIHGIPSGRRLLPGDIVGIDIGVCLKGLNVDTARTYPVGNISEETARLLRVTREALDIAVKTAVLGKRVGDIGNAVYIYVKQFGYQPVREYFGHGVGKSLHEDPGVPNYGKAGTGQRLALGMTLAIEPMINAGTHEIDVLDDKWTVVTRDGKLSAHYEHTVVVTDNGPVILTTE